MGGSHPSPALSLPAFISFPPPACPLLYLHWTLPLGTILPRRQARARGWKAGDSCAAHPGTGAPDVVRGGQLCGPGQAWEKQGALPPQLLARGSETAAGRALGEGTAPWLRPGLWGQTAVSSQPGPGHAVCP